MPRFIAQQVTYYRCSEWAPHERHVEGEQLANLQAAYNHCSGEGYGLAGWESAPCGLLKAHAPHDYQCFGVVVRQLWCEGDATEGGTSEDG